MSHDIEALQRHHTAGTITEREYQALHLHHIKHLSYRQIAAGLGLSLSTVADRVRRAHQKIHLAERTPPA